MSSESLPGQRRMWMDALLIKTVACIRIKTLAVILVKTVARVLDDRPRGGHFGGCVPCPWPSSVEIGLAAFPRLA